MGLYELVYKDFFSILVHLHMPSLVIGYGIFGWSFLSSSLFSDVMHWMYISGLISNTMAFSYGFLVNFVRWLVRISFHRFFYLCRNRRFLGESKFWFVSGNFHGVWAQTVFRLLCNGLQQSLCERVKISSRNLLSVIRFFLSVLIKR